MKRIYKKYPEYFKDIDLNTHFFNAFDFEAMLVDIDVKSGDNTLFNKQNVPLSVSIISNLKNETKYFCAHNESEIKTMMRHMIDYANLILDEHYNMMKQKLQPLFDFLNSKLGKSIKKNVEKSEKSEKSERLKSKSQKLKKENICIQNLRKEISELDSFIRHMPIIGFNSGNYDINICKKYELIDCLMGEEKKAIEGILKKGNKCLSFLSDKLHWLDMSNYLSQGTLLDDFIKMTQTVKTPISL